jgi:hypothetical protein
MFQTTVQLRYPTHRISIAQDLDRDLIQCFKHNDRSCDIQLFSNRELEQLADFILEPLPGEYWGFSPDPETD